MHILRVGELYNPERTSWPESVEYNWRDGRHELHVRWNHITRREEKAVIEGPIDLALYVHQPVILFLYRFRVGEWGDAPYQFQRVVAGLGPQELPPLLDDLDETQTYPIHIPLIEATSGILRGYRIVGPAREFMAALHRAIREQAEMEAGQMAFDGLLQQLYKSYSSTALVGRAGARCRIERGEGDPPNG